MMLIASLSAALIVGGILLAIYGVKPRPVEPRRRKVRSVKKRSTTRFIVLAGIAAGSLIAGVTGWLVAIVVTPAVAVIVTRAIQRRRAPEIERLEALAEFARAVAGVLSVGRGMEQAIEVAARSAPQALHTEITRLAARIRASWATTKALRAFADDVDDATCDLLVGTLVLAAERRGSGVADAMQGLAESIDAEVRARREIAAEQKKPKTAATIITIISTTLLVALFFTGQYVDPYTSPLGQVALMVYMALYLLILSWMSRMTRTTPLPRFMGAAAREEIGS